VLEDELLLIIGVEHDRILVKGPNPAAQLDSAHQVNGDGRFIFASSIKKGVLNVLRRLCFHFADLSLYPEPD
jgi:hypothetical protein